MLRHRQPDLTLLMENVHKPRNLAAILRTCDAVGVGKIYATSHSKEFTMRLKAAGGANHWVELEYFESIKDLAVYIQELGFRICAAHLDTTAKDFREVDYTRPTAILMGQELLGVTQTARDFSDETIHIPIAGMGESLNVSVAAAAILFEAQKQRKAAGFYNERRLDTETYQRLLFEYAYPEASRRLKRVQEPYPTLSKEGHILKS